VRELARGARVLNLFSYTCAFSVVAGLGGASRTVSVDASVVALEWGRANFEGAGITLAKGPDAVHSFVAEDVFAWLTRAATKNERFDLVIVDPPSYSSTKKRRFVAESDYGDLVAMVAKVLAPHGKVVACCNHRGLTRSKLRRFVAQGLKGQGGAELSQLKDLPDAPDFPPPLGREPHMKSVLATLA
jgi:23S rRNA (cytosine1962-C5)-methyltransferase